MWCYEKSSITGVIISNSARATNVTGIHNYLDPVVRRSYRPCDGRNSLAGSPTECLRMLKLIQG
jgi:hypothetical protein